MDYRCSGIRYGQEAFHLKSKVLTNVIQALSTLIETYYEHATRRGKKVLEFFLAIKMKARTVVGRGEKSPLFDPGSELQLMEGERQTCEDNKSEGKKKEEQKY